MTKDEMKLISKMATVMATLSGIADRYYRAPLLKDLKIFDDTTDIDLVTMMTNFGNKLYKQDEE